MGMKNIVHRDLKPENILLNSKSEGVFDVRIADFGFALINKRRKNREDNNQMANICGTPGYIAPEVFDGNCIS